MGIGTFSYCFSDVEHTAWDLESSQLISMHMLDSSIIFCETHVGFIYTSVTDNLINKQKKSTNFTFK